VPIQEGRFERLEMLVQGDTELSVGRFDSIKVIVHEKEAFQEGEFGLR
jgi:hypothetical protein